MPSRPLLAALVLMQTAALADDAPDGVLDRLQGSWQAEAGPTSEVIVTLSIDGDRFAQVVETGARAAFTSSGRLQLDPSADPSRLDWLDVVGPDGAPVPDAPAIFALDGDTLTICSAAPGGDRPESFEAGRGRFPSLRTYRRVVDTDDAPPAGDLLAMQGTWTATLGPEGSLEASLSIRGRTARFVIVGPDGQEVLASSGRVRLDESAVPKAMDWIPEAEGAGPILSIYELDGPSLRVSLGIGRGPTPRPEAFTEGFRTFTLTKATDADEPDDEPDSDG